MATAKEQMDFIKEADDNLEGFGDLSSATMAIPFLKLAQQLSPQINPKKVEHIEGLELGQFFNSVTGQVYGAHLEIIIIKFERIYIQWLPNRGGFVGYLSPDAAQALAEEGDMTFGKWKTKEGDDLVEYYAYYVLLNGHEIEGPIIMSLTSTAIKAAKALNRAMSTHIMDNGKRAMPFYLIYNVDAVEQTKGTNDFYGYKFSFKSYINEEQYKIVGGERLALPDKPVDYAQIENKSTGNAEGSKEDEF